MNAIATSEAAKAVVRRNTEEVQSKGNFEVFEELRRKRAPFATSAYGVATASPVETS